MEFTQRNIDNALLQIEGMGDEKVSMSEFKKWQGTLDRENQMRSELINKLEK